MIFKIHGQDLEYASILHIYYKNKLLGYIDYGDDTFYCKICKNWFGSIKIGDLESYMGHFTKHYLKGELK